MSRLTTATLAGLRSIDALAGVAVTYSRGTSSVNLTATPGRGQINEEGEMTVEYANQDWMIFATNLLLGGVLSRPTRGDRIICPGGRLAGTYEVLTPPFTWSDNEGYRLRIHTAAVP